MFLVKHLRIVNALCISEASKRKVSRKKLEGYYILSKEEIRRASNKFERKLLERGELAMDLNEYIPIDSEKGTGLILKHRDLYLFHVSGRKHLTEPGERFFAGVGGHCEDGESFIEAVQREAIEEIGRNIKIVHSAETYFVDSEGEIIDILKLPLLAPKMIYKMIDYHRERPKDKTYFIACFEAEIADDCPFDLDPEEASALIAIPAELLIQSLEWKIGAKEIVDSGGIIMVGCLENDTLLFPLGTAVALAHFLKSNKADA